MSFCALLLITGINPSYCVEGKIDSDTIKIKDMKSLTELPNVTSKEQVGLSIQPAPESIDNSYLLAEVPQRKSLSP